MSEEFINHTPEEHDSLRARAKRIVDGIQIPVETSVSLTESGRDINDNQLDNPTDIVMLGREGIRPSNFYKGKTEIILQRHGKYIRDKNDPKAGQLTEEAIQLETTNARIYFTELIAQVPESERHSIYVLFVSSDTVYANNGQRSYQTTEIAQQVARQLFREHNIPLENILNFTPDLEDKPMVISELREPQMFEQTPDFVNYMIKKYGELGKDFWIAFEEDTEIDARISMGAEGPDEIANRLKYAVELLVNYSNSVHKENPDSRLVIWAGTHYDTISPFVKRDILRKEKRDPVLVDYGGGVVIDVDKSGKASVNVSGESYEFNVLAK